MLGSKLNDLDKAILKSSSASFNKLKIFQNMQWWDEMPDCVKEQFHGYNYSKYSYTNYTLRYKEWFDVWYVIRTL